MKRAPKSLCAGRSFEGDLFYGDFWSMPYWPCCRRNLMVSIDHLRSQIGIGQNVSTSSRRFQCRSK